MTAKRSLRIHDDVDELILSIVGGSATASYTSALEDIIRGSALYKGAAEMDLLGFATLVQRGRRIVRKNVRRTGNTIERRRQVSSGLRGT